MKRDEERARKMWRDIGVAAMQQHSSNSLHHHSHYNGNGSGPGNQYNPHWNQPGYRNSYSLPHPSQNGGQNGRYQQHYEIKPLSQSPSFQEISHANQNGSSSYPIKPRPISMYEMGNGKPGQQLHSLPPNFVPHQNKSNSRSPMSKQQQQQQQQQNGLRQQPEELVSVQCHPRE